MSSGHPYPNKNAQILKSCLILIHRKKKILLPNLGFVKSELFCNAIHSPDLHAKIQLPKCQLLHEYTTPCLVLFHGRVTNMTIHTQLTFPKHNSFVISDFKELENMQE